MTALAFYVREGDAYVPTAVGVSPWNPAAQMGVALAGLVAQVLDGVPAAGAMVTTRLTVDILGAVPIAPMHAATRILREGRRVQLVEGTLSIGGRPWVRATALRVREGASPATTTPLAHPPPAAGDAGDGPPWVKAVRLVGDYQVPGPGAQWVRIAADVVAGEPVPPIASVTMVADFGSGTAPLVPMRDWTFANVDISVHLTRTATGPWILVDALSESAGNGIGVTHSRLGDVVGMIGMAHQTTFLERR